MGGHRKGFQSHLGRRGQIWACFPEGDGLGVDPPEASLHTVHTSVIVADYRSGLSALFPDDRAASAGKWSAFRRLQRGTWPQHGGSCRLCGSIRARRRVSLWRACGVRKLPRWAGRRRVNKRRDQYGENRREWEGEERESQNRGAYDDVCPSLWPWGAEEQSEVFIYCT